MFSLHCNPIILETVEGGYFQLRNVLYLCYLVFACSLPVSSGKVVDSFKYICVFPFYPSILYIISNSVICDYFVSKTDLAAHSLSKKRIPGIFHNNLDL